MLAEELNRDRKEHPEELHKQYGECRYCKQLFRLETFIAWQQEKCNEAATELCRCIKSITHQKHKAKKERAEKVIENKFGEKSQTKLSEETRELLKMIAGELAAERISKGTVSIEGGKLKVTISESNKGNIKVERVLTKKEAEEC